MPAGAVPGFFLLIEAERRLTAARKQLEETSKTARQALPDLLSRLTEHPDERARQAQTALGGRQWDLGTIDALAVGDQQPDSGIPGRLRQVTALVLPSPEAVNTAAERLAKAEHELTGQAGTPAGDAQRTASLLTAALAHYAAHPGESCPVCAGRQLDEPRAADAPRRSAGWLSSPMKRTRSSASVTERPQALRTTLPSEPPVPSEISARGSARCDAGRCSSGRS